MFGLEVTIWRRFFFFLTLDTIISFLTLFISYLLRFNFDFPEIFFPVFWKFFFFITFLKLLSLYFFKIYFVTWRFFSLKEFSKIIKAHLISYIFGGIVVLSLYDFFNPFPRSVLLIDLFLSIFFISFLRISKRILNEFKTEKSKEIPTLVFGVNENTHLTLKYISASQENLKVVAIFDDDSSKVGTYIDSLKVHSTSELKDIVVAKRIESGVIVKKLSPHELDNLFEKLNKIKVKNIRIAQFLNQREQKLKNISLEDLLIREPKDLDISKIQSFINGKVILITGAGGSIGSEISRQCARFKAKMIILVDNSEFNLYKIDDELSNKKVLYMSKLVSVLDKKHFRAIFERYRPEIVIHSAAYKHVPLVEFNPESAIANNIIGTKNSIDLSIEFGVEKFVLISSDKAVRPTNIMGATKRVCELYAQNVKNSQTEIISVRFGNVLGSSGSVVPKFRSQIEKGEAVTVTHPDATRYFMLIPEACQLVLQAGSIGVGGEIFILDMGEPVKILDLAKKMIKLSGKNIEIKFKGLRTGEKLYEELLIDDAEEKTRYESILVAKPTEYNILQLSKQIEDLKLIDDKLKIIEKLKEILPEFNHKTN